MARIERGPWATGIGSLPFTGEESRKQACELVARFEREIPFVFELPRAFPDDALIRRPLAGLLEPGEMAEARLRVSIDEARKHVGTSEPVEFLDEHLIALQKGETSGRERWFKCQVCGPAALGTWVLDSAGKPLRDTPEGRELVLESIKKLAGLFLGHVPGCDCGISRLGDDLDGTLVFFDEPGVGKDVRELTSVIEFARGLAAIVGVHDCGPDFRNALAAKPDILSFDFASFGARVGDTGDPIAEFVRGGGSLAWGAISTGPTARRFDPSVTAGAIRTAALRLMGSKAGADELLARSLVTPACGTALLEPAHATSLHLRAIQVAELLRLGR